MGRKTFFIALMLAVAVVLGVLVVRGEIKFHSPSTDKEIMVSEAVHTLLYLPVYHAAREGYFAEEGLNVHITTAGTPTSAFAALISKNADFAVADPMYVPISRQSGTRLKVVGAVVGRIALWAMAKDPKIENFDRESLVGKAVSTNARPTTAYTYTELYLRSLGLQDGKDVTVIQTQPGSEVVPLLSGASAFVVGLEPAASTAEVNGAHEVYSWPDSVGERVFASISTREDFLSANRDTTVRFIKGISRALADIRAHPNDALITAKWAFPQTDPRVLTLAIKRLIQDRVFPDTPFISETSWSGAVEARKSVGDLTTAAPYEENFDASIVRDATPPQ